MNENTTLLKLIAVACMIVDHMGVALFPQHLWMRVVGRAAFPLFCWCIAVGARYTRNIWRYAGRLVTLYVISQPFYNMALNHTWATPNIFLTLLMGLIGIAGLRRKWYWLTALMIITSMLTRADYGMRGVLCILLLYALMDHPPALAAGFALFCAAWSMSASYTIHTPWLDIPLSWGGSSRNVFRIGSEWMRLQTLAVMALPLMLLPMKKRTKIPVPDKLLYWAYPAHLAIIWAVKSLLPA